jgi:hypothetical protein
MSSRTGFPIELRRPATGAVEQYPPKPEGNLNFFRLGSQVKSCSLSPVPRRVERYRD